MFEDALEWFKSCFRLLLTLETGNLWDSFEQLLLRMVKDAWECFKSLSVN